MPIIFQYIKNYFNYYPQKIISKQYEKGTRKIAASADKSVFLRIIELIEKYSTTNKAPTILDLGCGKGMLGYYCRLYNKNYIIDGVDYDIPRNIYIKNSYRNLFRKNIVNLKINRLNKKYDFIVMSHFLEHLRQNDVVKILKNVSGLPSTIIIASPIAHLTFAYNYNYLQGSLQESKDISQKDLNLLIAMIHKNIINYSILKKYNFRLIPPPSWGSDYFIKYPNYKKSISFVEINKVKASKVNKVLMGIYKKNNIALPRPKNRMLYEKELLLPLITEPLIYKLFRKIIFIIRYVLKIHK